jgi:UDP-glucose 4-epimerase
MKNILVTGGAGYIGSHMVYYLLEKDYRVFVLDNFSTSDYTRLEKIQKHLKKRAKVIEQDIAADLENIKIHCEIDAVVHFAGYKSVPESIKKPFDYYENNVYGTTKLLRWALEHDIKRIVYSSSSAIYGDTEKVPIVEKSEKNPLSPYAKTKLFCENILEDACSHMGMNCVSLRYFNVAGNIDNGMMGDDVKSAAIIPSILRSHFKKDTTLEIYGSDYDTKDGTPVRDFIHISDLVDAHFKALKFLEDNEGFEAFNIGSQEGYSILELVNAFESVVGDKLRYQIKDRKEGDIAISVSDCTKAKKLLNWKPTKDLEDIFKSMLRYYENEGFR